MYSAEKRSSIMATVKGANTAPEREVKARLWSEGFRFARSHHGLPGKPDIVLPKLNTVIFVHGCFWHGHSCKDGTLPKSNRSYWEKKIAQNVQRDQKVVRSLRLLGWHCFHVRTCSLDRDSTRVLTAIKKIKCK